MDVVDKATRSRMMSGIRTKGTKPEIAVRKLLHRLGYRYRLHRLDLPGSPDICLPKFRTVIFVHGCYWHRHNCKKASMPATNVDRWARKFKQNVIRDKRNLNDLHRLGWRTIVLWECGVKSAPVRLENDISVLIGCSSEHVEWPSGEQND